MQIQKSITRGIQSVFNYLTFNRTEQRGIFVLCLVLSGLIISNAVIPSGTFQKPPDFSAFSKEITAFEAAWHRAADSDSIARKQKYLKYRNRFNGYRHDSLNSIFIKPKPVVMVELNSADTFDLQQLRGIGPSFARRIVNYRERLRGFSNKMQLLEVFGMDTARFAMIEPNLKVNPDSVKPIDLNVVTFKELLRHPYFPFPVTKNIMIYRQKNKNFKSLEELRKIDGVSDSLFRRMVVYLRLGP
ncbi:MAG: ComEA family DNA-binding protein [Bacteroidales bacterium]